MEEKQTELPHMTQGMTATSPPPQTVIIQAPRQQVISRTPVVYSEQWQTPFCGCCNSDECCYAYFCAPCWYCDLAQKFGDGCFAACVIPLYVYRSVYRHKNKIQGSNMNDVCATACCWPCVGIQLSEEIRKRGGPMEEVQVQYHH